MGSWAIYDNTGKTIKYVIHKVEYNGTHMSERYVATTINSEYPINFEIGDYLVYRGEVFTLNYVPPKKKQSRNRTYGEGFVYDNIKFNSYADELTRCDFLDYVADDNMIHYTGLSVFSFYASDVRALAERIQVNLDRLYTGDKRWTVIVDESCTTIDVNVSVSQNNCYEALTLVNSSFYTNYTVKGRTVTIGAAAVEIDNVFGYGKGNGLYDIGQTTNQDTKIITRLRAFGSTKNIPYRYYNKHGLSESQYCPNLMLPDYIEKGLDTYIDADGYQNGGEYEANEDKIKLYGIREGTVYFDGSVDLFGTGEDNEIYPTLEEMTYEQVKAAGYDITQPEGDNGKLDEILSATNPEDDGLAPEDGSTIPSTFKIRIKDFGVDLSERENGAYKLASTEGTMTVSMKSGMCRGREFEIVENGIRRVEEDGYVCYELECNRVEDLIYYYPNNTYVINPGDEFVLIYIQMPDVYVEAAEQRLLASAKLYLPEVYETKFNYSPSIDELWMKRHPEFANTICEGMLLKFSDSDLGIAAVVTISNLVIKEDNDNTSYEVTLNDDVEASTIDKITAQLDKIASGSGTGGGLSKAQVNSLIQTVGAQLFLSKTSADTANGKLTFNKGFQTKDNATFGDFASGMTGFGGRIDAKGNAELENVVIRQGLTVPIISYNKEEITVGNRWQTKGAGVIETVTPDTDKDGNILATGTATLKVEDGEIGAIAVDDICQGIWHNISGGNETENSDDSKGNFTFAGFQTVYFRIDEILDEDNLTFRYALRPVSDTWKSQHHPQPSMNFACYGNFTDESRQNSYYETPTYRRQLAGVNTWEFSASNIVMQDGDLSNLSVFGYDMTGWSSFIRNLYVAGTINQIDAIPLRLELSTDGDQFLAYGESLHIVCTVMKGWEEKTSEVTSWKVERDSSDAASDASWALRDKVKNFKGEIDICLDADPTVNDLGENDNVNKVIFTFTAVIDTETITTQLEI